MVIFPRCYSLYSATFTLTLLRCEVPKIVSACCHFLEESPQTSDEKCVENPLFIAGCGNRMSAMGIFWGHIMSFMSQNDLAG